MKWTYRKQLFNNIETKMTRSLISSSAHPVKKWISNEWKLLICLICNWYPVVFTYLWGQIFCWHVWKRKGIFLETWILFLTVQFTIIINLLSCIFLVRTKGSIPRQFFSDSSNMYWDRDTFSRVTFLCRKHRMCLVYELSWMLNFPFFEHLLRNTPKKFQLISKMIWESLYPVLNTRKSLSSTLYWIPWQAVEKGWNRGKPDVSLNIHQIPFPETGRIPEIGLPSDLLGPLPPPIQPLPACETSGFYHVSEKLFS